MVQSIVFGAEATPAVAPLVPGVVPLVPGAVVPPVVIAGDRPAWLPEKFNSPEAFAEAYTALERKQSAGVVPPVVPAVVTKTPEQIAAEAAQTPEQIEAARVEAANKATLATAGVDYPSLEASYAKDGKLSAEQYTKLAAVGFTKEIVDAHIASRVTANESTSAALTAAATTAAGSVEALNAMLAFAKASYTPAQIAAYNTAVDGGNKDTIALAVKGLRADYEKSTGVQPQRFLTPNSGSPTQGDQYLSMEQLLADQSKPLYKKDPAERARVEAKLRRSTAI